MKKLLFIMLLCAFGCTATNDFMESITTNDVMNAANSACIAINLACLGETTTWCEKATMRCSVIEEIISSAKSERQAKEELRELQALKRKVVD